MINNIDVTLRDGGYQNNFSFSESYVIEHVQNISESEIEWIEIAYRNGSYKQIPNIGITGRGDNSYIENIKKHSPKANLCMIAHAHNISQKDIESMHRYGAQMLRLCINSDNQKKTLQFAEVAKSLGMKVCINATRASQLSIYDLLDFVAKSEKSNVDIFYLADSNGSMMPESVSSLVSILNGATTMDIGFHAHDNLSLAMANSIAAKNSGAKYIDSSLFGMGKGAGNLNMETWTSYLNKKGNAKKYQLSKILEQAVSLKKHHENSRPERSILDIILADKDLSVEYKLRPEFNNLVNIQNAMIFAAQLKKSA
ncbi:MAG: hypothetical protein PUP46_04825 [Endozoicomonas sp. (ex Botrylloides leachii)]|nr:hypothetical protein [Endozoicomonas sp. (ex Botrylloides leachii)]